MRRADNVTNNRLHNVTNPWQGDTKKVLCVCSAGLLRAPTIANVLHSKYEYNVRAVGIEKEYALIPIDSALIYWADEIVVAEPWMAMEIAEHITDDTPIKSLNLPDEYGYMDTHLVEMIEQRYKAT